MIWILLSLNAALFFALRFVFVKKYLWDTDTYVLAFTARLFGFCALLPLLIFNEIKGYDTPLFWQTIAVTAVLTAGASIMQLNAVKKYDLSVSVPFLSFVPLFMLGSVYLIFNEVPSIDTLWGIIILCVGAYIINIQDRYSIFRPFTGLLKNRGGLLFLGVAVIYGLTTTLDRLAINTAGGGGFSYALFWNLFSTFLFAVIFFPKKKRPFYLREIQRKLKYLAAQGVLAAAAFYSQMAAIEFAKDLQANVIYVKALTMLQLLIGVIFGIVLFKEKNSVIRIVGAVFMICGAVLIIIFGSFRIFGI